MVVLTQYLIYLSPLLNDGAYIIGTSRSALANVPIDVDVNDFELLW